MKGKMLIGMVMCSALLVFLSGCGTKTTAGLEQTGEKQETADTQELQLPADLEEFTKEELNQAYERGILTAEESTRLTEPVTQSECLSMLDAVAKHLNIKVESQGSIGKGSDILTRADAAGRAIGAFYISLFKNADPIQFPAGELSEADCEKIGNSEEMEMLKWAVTTLDFTSNTCLLERDSDYSIRPLDNMTVEECALMMYRLSNYQIPEPEYVDFSTVPDYEIEDTLLNMAQAMPEASTDEVSFQGMVTDNKENDGTHSNMGLSFWYSKNQAQLLHDMGFNFTRVTNVFSEGGNGRIFGLLTSPDGTQVNMTHLKNLDDYIGWCIENGVHVCVSFFYYPSDSDYSKNLDHMKEFWTMMAKHYQKVPNNALSFNLINEPQGEETEIERISMELLDSVRKVDSERLIFLDSLNGDETTVWGGPSRKPSAALADQNIIETVHTYTGVFNGDHIVGSGAGGYPSQDVWPFPYVHCLFNDNSPITITGDFKEGEKVTVRARFTYEDTDTLHILLDGQEIETMQVGEGVSMDEGMSKCYDITLPADGKELLLQMNGLMQLYDIVIFHKEPSDNRIPYQTPWDYNYHTEKYTDQKITNIQCDWNMTNEDAPQHITVNEDATYTADKIEGWPAARVDYGYEGIKDYYKLWEQFKQDTGCNYMVQECGFYLWVNTPVSLRSHYMDEYLSILDENGVSWNTIDRAWLYGARDTDDTQSCKWEYQDGFRVNTTYLSVYQKHMQK